MHGNPALDGLLRELDVRAVSRVHVYPVSEAFLHYTFGGGADCYCEPEIINLGVDDAGKPARVFTHRRLMSPKGAMVQAKIAQT